MTALQRAAQRAGERGQRRACARLAAALQAHLNGQLGVTVIEKPDGVVVEARGFAQRLTGDPVLRWIGGMLR